VILTSGNKVIYPSQGPCLICQVIKKVIDGRPVSFYQLALLDDRGKRSRHFGRYLNRSLTRAKEKETATRPGLIANERISCSIGSAIENCGKRSKAKPRARRAPNPETTETGFSSVKPVD
jgi:hypothetical protein